MGNIIASSSPETDNPLPENQEQQNTDPYIISFKLQENKDVVDAHDIDDEELLEKMAYITNLTKYL